MPKVHLRRRKSKKEKLESNDTSKVLDSVVKSLPKPKAQKAKAKPQGGNCVICQQQENQKKYTKNGAVMKGYALVNEDRDIWKVVREEWVSFCCSEEHVPKNKNHIACDKQMHAVGYLDDDDLQWDFE